MKRKTWLAALAVAAGCGTTDPTQVLTGKVDATAEVIAVRAVDGTRVVAAAQIADDSSFALAVPAGTYELEMLTRTGVRPLVTSRDGSLAALTFQVCRPGAPWNIGNVGDPSGGNGPGNGGGNGSNGGGSGGPPPPPPPGCGSDNSGPNCPPPPPPSCGPNGSDCPPPPPGCGPNDNTGSDCPPPPPPTCGPNEPNGSDCIPPPPPPCNENNNGGSACPDPCGPDPTSCGCAANEPTCWPAPVNGGGSTTNGMLPSNPPGDFGCAGG
jgi:hypothetical protein